MTETTEIVELLLAHHWKAATAESCTGGMIADCLVDVAGVSGCFEEGYVTYSNDAKKKNLGVKDETLAAYGAVSPDTAREMAVGVRRRAAADFGLATTGIAGPAGGTADKPVGLVYIACAFGDTVELRRHVFSGTRSEVRRQAASAALKLLLDSIRRHAEGPKDRGE